MSNNKFAMSIDEEVDELFTMFEDVVPLTENLQDLTFVKDLYSP